MVIAVIFSGVKIGDSELKILRKKFKGCLFFCPKPLPICPSWERSYTALCASDLDIIFFSETQLFLDFSKKITSDRSETFFMQYFFSSLPI